MVNYERGERGYLMVSKEIRLRVSDRTYEILEKISQDLHCSKAFIVRLALSNYLSRKGFYRK